MFEGDHHDIANRSAAGGALAAVCARQDAVMQTPSPWATKADIEALRADIDALHANLVAMHRALRQELLTELRDRRPWWWRRLRWALRGR
jgi:hypothetical protein